MTLFGDRPSIEILETLVSIFGVRGLATILLLGPSDGDLPPEGGNSFAFESTPGPRLDFLFLLLLRLGMTLFTKPEMPRFCLVKFSRPTVISVTVSVRLIISVSLRRREPIVAASEAASTSFAFFPKAMIASFDDAGCVDLPSVANAISASVHGFPAVKLVSP